MDDLPERLVRLETIVNEKVIPWIEKAEERFSSLWKAIGNIQETITGLSVRWKVIAGMGSLIGFIALVWDLVLKFV